MKRIIFCLLVSCLMIGFSPSAFAQTYNAKIGDTTVANAKTPYYDLTVSGPKSNVSFQYIITKNSGTVAGTIALQGTLDGTNWATINTYTLTDASASTSLSYAYNGYIKYRVQITTSGTLNANFKVWANYRP